MSFFDSGGGRAPTHRPVDVAELARLVRALEARFPERVVTLEDTRALALAEGVPHTWVLVAAALAPGLTVRRQEPRALVHCVGGCQQWGALERLEQSLAAREGGAPFDVVPVACLDRCDFSPVVRVEVPEGVAMIVLATREKLDEAIAALS